MPDAGLGLSVEKLSAHASPLLSGCSAVPVGTMLTAWCVAFVVQKQNAACMPSRRKLLRGSRSKSSDDTLAEQARLKTEEQARLKVEEEARLKAEEEARLKEEEEAELIAQEEDRAKAEEESRLKAEAAAAAPSEASSPKQRRPPKKRRGSVVRRNSVQEFAEDVSNAMKAAAALFASAKPSTVLASMRASERGTDYESTRGSERDADNDSGRGVDD